LIKKSDYISRSIILSLAALFNLIVLPLASGQQLVNGGFNPQPGIGIANGSMHVIPKELVDSLFSQDPNGACLSSFNEGTGNYFKYIFPDRILGFDTLSSEGMVGKCLFRYKLVNYDNDTNNLYYRTYMNSDTLHNSGWSMKLNDTLSPSKKYELSMVLNAPHAIADHPVYTQNILEYDPLDMYKDVLEFWYLRIGLSTDPYTEGDSIGVVTKENYSKTISTFFSEGYDWPRWQKVSHAYAHREFTTIIQTTANPGKYLTFRFVSRPKIGHIMTVPRDVFTCEKFNEIAFASVFVDDFRLSLVTDINVNNDSCFNSGTIQLFTPHPEYSHKWSTKDTTSSIEIDKPGTYWVEINNNGCIGTDTIQITGWNCDSTALDIYIPNAFTPDGDGLNDLFGPVGLNRELLNLSVYNRWGEQIYSSTNFWDGEQNRTPAPEGVYLYTMLIKSETPERTIISKKSGTIHLLRHTRQY
jgi:gliding motility-associated-like protein